MHYTYALYICIIHITRYMLFIFMCICIYLCIYIRIHIHVTYTCTQTQTYTCTYSLMYKCMCICIRIDLYIFTHTPAPEPIEKNEQNNVYTPFNFVRRSFLLVFMEQVVHLLMNAWSAAALLQTGALNQGFAFKQISKSIIGSLWNPRAYSPQRRASTMYCTFIL